MSVALSGEEESGMVIVRQKPLMAEVSIRDESRASLSCGIIRERNWTRGLIMNEFHKNVSSKLSISKELEFTGLLDLSALAQGYEFEMSVPVLNSVRKVEVSTVIEGTIAEKLPKLVARMLHCYLSTS